MIKECRRTILCTNYFVKCAEVQRLEQSKWREQMLSEADCDQENSNAKS